jgi:hypothetical protein
LGKRLTTRPMQAPMASGIPTGGCIRHTRHNVDRAPL